MTGSAEGIKRQRAAIAYYDRYRHGVRRGSARDNANRKRIRTAGTPIDVARMIIERLSIPENHAVTTAMPRLEDLESMILPGQPMDPTQRQLFEKIADLVEVGSLSWPEVNSLVAAWYQTDAWNGCEWVRIKPPKRP